MKAVVNIDWSLFVGHVGGMKRMAASKFKEKCLSVLEHVDEEGIVITKHGKAIARIVPYREASGELIGSLKGVLEINGDILTTGIGWNADAG